MMKQPVNTRGHAMTIPGGLAMAGLVEMILTATASIILAVLIKHNIISWENIGYGVMAMLFLVGLIGAVTAAEKIKHRKLLVCGAAGILYWLLLLAVTGLFFGGQYEAVGETALVIIFSSICASLFSLHKKKNRKKKF